MLLTDLGPDWLARALDVDVARLAGLTSGPVGTGQVADTYRLAFTLDGQARSLVLKLTPADATSRKTSRWQSSFVREVGFYRDLAGTVTVRTPRCWFAEVSEDGGDFALLLEDLTPCTPGDQLKGCTLDEVEAVLDQAAGLHAPRWGDPRLADLDWLPGGSRPRARLTQEMATGAFAMFRERYGHLLDDDVLAVGADLYGRIDAYYDAQLVPPETVVHGDFRPDNMLFDGQGGTVPVTVVDWQTVQRGPGVLDVAYFVGGALAPDDRRHHERALLGRYHEALVGRGVTGYSFDDAWADYARFSLQNYIVGLGASLSVKRTERGDRLFVEMVRRSGLHAIDLDALSLF